MSLALWERFTLWKREPGSEREALGNPGVLWLGPGPTESTPESGMGWTGGRRTVGGKVKKEGEVERKDVSME